MNLQYTHQRMPLVSVINTCEDVKVGNEKDHQVIHWLEGTVQGEEVTRVEGICSGVGRQVGIVMEVSKFSL